MIKEEADLMQTIIDDYLERIENSKKAIIKLSTENENLKKTIKEYQDEERNRKCIKIDSFYKTPDELKWNIGNNLKERDKEQDKEKNNGYGLVSPNMGPD